MIILKIVSESELFQGLNESQLQRVVDIAKTKNLPGGVTIFNEGDNLKDLYLVQDGSIRLSMRVQLWSGNAALHSIVSIIGPGGTFGWSSMIEPYQATMTAATENKCALVAIDASVLRNMLDEDLVAGYRVMIALA